MWLPFIGLLHFLHCPECSIADILAFQYFGKGSFALLAQYSVFLRGKKFSLLVFNQSILLSMWVNRSSIERNSHRSSRYKIITMCFFSPPTLKRLKCRSVCVFAIEASKTYRRKTHLRTEGEEEMFEYFTSTKHNTKIFFFSLKEK